MMTKKSDELRRAWMGKLAMMTSPAFPLDVGKVFVTYLPHLEDFGDEVFTDATLRAVATAPNRHSVPPYAEIVAVLGRLWRESRPMPIAIAAPPPPPQKTPEEMAAEADAISALLAAWRAEGVRQRPAPHVSPAPSVARLPPYVNRDANVLVRRTRAVQAAQEEARNGDGQEG